MDENVTIYRQYFGCLAFPTRYQQTIVDLRKNRKISVNIADISVMDRHIGLKIGKICSVQKNAKKKKKIILADKSADIADISANIGPIDSFFFFFFLDPTAINC